MEIHDTATRCLLIRLFAQRRERIIAQLKALYPTKTESFDRVLKESLSHNSLEPTVVYGK